MVPRLPTKEPTYDINNKRACAPSKDSDKPWRQTSMVRVFAVRMMKSLVLSHSRKTNEVNYQTRSDPVFRC